MQTLIAALQTIIAKDGQAPEWVLLFAAGWNELEGGAKYLVDRLTFELVQQYIARRGNDIVWDYEHQSVEKAKAPAAGWIKELRWSDEKGIEARVEWTEEAAGYLCKKEYRYFSPVFGVRKNDQRVMGLHSVALTNVPRTNHLTPLAARLSDNLEEENMEWLEKLKKELGLADDASGEDVLAAVIDKITPTEVVAKDVITALDLSADADASMVVASIHALKQGTKGMVSRDEFIALEAKLKARDADDLVVAALKAGKITPDQKQWATDYATGDPNGFETFVAKAPVVIPLTDLPGKKEDGDHPDIAAATLEVAKMMGVSAEDIKQYGAE